MKTSYFFTKNNLKSFFRPGWKGMGDPGVEEVETRIFVKPERGCGAVYLPCLRRFYALFLKKKVCRNTRCAFFFSLTIKIGSFF